LTDIIMDTPPHDYLRGLSKIMVTLVNFCTLFMIIAPHRKRILVFTFGIIAGQTLSFFINPSSYATGYPWKFGLGPPTTMLIIVLSTYFKKDQQISINPKYLFPLLAGVINIYLGFRSLAGICFLTFACILLQNFFYNYRSKNSSLSIRKTILLAIVLFASSIIIVETYEILASKGYLGKEQQMKYSYQAGKLGLFLGGRSEILVSSKAILESPIIGHGSWAKNQKYAKMIVDLKKKMGYVTGPANELGLIPTHSHLFGAWVEAGIVGAIFWGWMLSLSFRASIRLFTTKDPHFPFLIFIAILMSWHILFSPFGGARRFLMPFYSICMIDVLMRYPTRQR